MKVIKDNWKYKEKLPILVKFSVALFMVLAIVAALQEFGVYWF